MGLFRKRKTVLVKCIDCKRIINTNWGETPKTKEEWGLCDRCSTKRSGARLALKPDELGVF